MRRRRRLPIPLRVQRTPNRLMPNKYKTLCQPFGESTPPRAMKRSWLENLLALKGQGLEWSGFREQTITRGYVTSRVSFDDCN